MMGIIAITTAYISAKRYTPNPQNTPSVAQATLQRSMKKLWIDYAVWYRQLMVSMVAGLKDVDANRNRLLKTNNDLGKIITPYYEKNIGTQFTTLLEEHLTIGSNIIK